MSHAYITLKCRKCGNIVTHRFSDTSSDARLKSFEAWAEAKSTSPIPHTCKCSSVSAVVFHDLVAYGFREEAQEPEESAPKKLDFAALVRSQFDDLAKRTGYVASDSEILAFIENAKGSIAKLGSEQEEGGPHD